LRGLTHLATVPLAIAGAISLVVVSGGNVARQISLGIYGVSIVLLFAVSASYHRGPWSPRTRSVWRRLDHATIFVAIAGTYTPVVVNVLKGWPSIVLLVVIWVLAISGVVVATTGVPLPRWVTVVLYIAVACTVVFFLPALADRIHASGVIVLLIGGGLYSAGAAAYALRWPRLWPYVFGYHEVFHIFVIAATAVYFVFIMDTVALSR
jgi:hemolysin III